MILYNIIIPCSFIGIYERFIFELNRIVWFLKYNLYAVLKHDVQSGSKNTYPLLGVKLHLYDEINFETDCLL